MTYAGGRGHPLASTTQVFKSGEIWGVNQYLLRKRDDYPNLVPTGAYEGGLIQSLRTYLDAARNHFGYPSKIMMESGLVNVTDFVLAMPDNYFDRFWGPIFEDVKVTTRVDMDTPETITDALLTIFKAVFEAAGMSRPDGLNNFPPPVNHGRSR
jgi:hypothetical protein